MESLNRTMTTMEKPPIPSSSSADCKPLTTFVQTNTDAFREVVQRLTGPSSMAGEGMASKEGGCTKKNSSKLHERRKYMKPKVEIVKSSSLHCKSGACSPSVSRSSSYPASPVSGSFPASPLTPSTIFSKLSILEDDKKDDLDLDLNIAVPSETKMISTEEQEEDEEEEEERAIRERRFYLHPSPRPKPGFSEPELLPLFPMASTEKV
ncbi:hypothetical protein HN51_036840 [Arachis hypogaea]|uniref:VQ motif-containing protein 31-like n=1 Tax=Arachis ipaensis TaxID=130454 RepID=UPI0007AEF004|nr:VQ motif-containing protein 31-like [Arachis ipaensis]XP_016193515.1 VQ motif-containing protein 31-like [Arachis ipaensis]XP_025637599.1 VQ motif-containing protein 31-like [Arachis hypogaea]XP_025637600.1 VQ motif-containing protein 31-like [Arachis hypogaea]